MDYRDFMIVRNGENKIGSKELGAQMAPIHESAQFTFHLDAFFASLRDHKICIDITGGTDTRALAIVLNHQGYAFDIAINGDKQFAETIIAEQVATQIGKKLKGYTIHENEIAKEDLRLAWQACDGLNLSLGSYFFEKWRKNFGYSLVVSGKGANLFKDDSFLRYAILFLLLQKDIANFVDTLVKKGIMFWWARPFYELLNILSKDYRELATDIIEKKIAEITVRYRKYSLIESANRIFYEYSLNNPSGTTHELITRYCPYFEPEMVNIAIGLPILKRFNCYFYRNHVGKLNPGAAKIRTHPYGHKMSGSFNDIVFDYAYLLKQTLLKTLTPDVISKRAPDINLQKIQRYVFEHPDMARGLSDLKKKGIINRNLELHQMNLRLATNVLQLHYLMEQ
jgi:asparagine synthetase B (glutamine-hydrolysing)